jgi:hypothetical protein
MMLSARTDADRQLVLAREEAFNDVLAQECGNHAKLQVRGIRGVQLRIHQLPGEQARLLPPEPLRTSGSGGAHVGTFVVGCDLT